MLDLAWLNRFLCIIGYEAENFCLEFFNQLGSLYAGFYLAIYNLPEFVSR